MTLATVEPDTPPVVQPSRKRGFRTLAEQIGLLEEFAKNPQKRIRTGLTSLDLIIEGPAAGEVCTFLGRSYAGKSQVATNILANNPNLGIVFFSLEMPARMALTRLYSSYVGVTTDEMNRALNEGHLPRHIERVAEELKGHVIMDSGDMTLGDMSFQIEQYAEYMGQRPNAVIIDYLELVQGGTGEGSIHTEQIARGVKAWAKAEDVAVFLLHQTNRLEPQWEAPHADSARGAGYTEADFVIGLWQPSTNPKLSATEEAALDGEIRMNVIKNRPFGRLTSSQFPLHFRLDDSLRIVDLEARRAKREVFAEETERIAG